ncbi:MAG TPA: NADH-quinone oxidoreductase subunit J, partial [Kofleriaceae bacterium]
MRLLILLTALFMLGGVAAPLVAEAQPAPAGAPSRPVAGQPGVKTSVVKKHPHSDRVESKGKGMALLFWAFAAATIGGALFVITRRNLIAAVMGMVGSFIGISATYMMLYAHFLSVIQMLVYAGAIMVLFVFVIMILNRPEDEPIAPSGRIGQVVGGAAILYLVYRLVMLLVSVKVPNDMVALNAPEPVQLPPLKPGTPGELVDWGSTKAVGADLFGPGLFPFEAISILVLVA